jgi:hypothetical protein
MQSFKNEFGDLTVASKFYMVKMPRVTVQGGYNLVQNRYRSTYLINLNYN